MTSLQKEKKKKAQTLWCFVPSQLWWRLFMFTLKAGFDLSFTVALFFFLRDSLTLSLSLCSECFFTCQTKQMDVNVHHAAGEQSMNKSKCFPDNEEIFKENGVKKTEESAGIFINILFHAQWTLWSLLPRHFLNITDMWKKKRERVRE